MSSTTHVRPSTLLQTALRSDTIACALFAVAVLFLMISKSVVEQLDVPPVVLIGAGLVALVGVPLLWSMVRRERLRRSSVWVLMASNFLWAIVSIVAVVTGWIKPTTLGATIIIGQGIVTFLIAEMELIGLRGSTSRQSLDDGRATVGSA